VKCPRLDELPPPPAGTSGWPWTEQTAPPPPGGPDLPTLSIVTPSFNQGAFIEQTLRSVLLQGYPDIEYLVIDGGSTDQSVEIIRKYERWLTFWTSEPDRGQSHAINKGLQRCTGQVFNWLNSDDWFAAGAFAAVGGRWTATQPDVLVGRGVVVDSTSAEVLHDWLPRPATGPLDFIAVDGIVMPQPATFVSRQLMQHIGGVREDLHYVMDWELYLRLIMRRRRALVATATPALLSYSRIHAEAKTAQQPAAFRDESLQVLRKLTPLSPIERARIALFLRGIETQRQISAALRMRRGALKRLAQLLLGRPDAALSRFFWGAVRRSLSPDEPR
jgi:glycosyltransferase involved in cell wall biosynthesis